MGVGDPAAKQSLPPSGVPRLTYGRPLHSLISFVRSSGSRKRDRSIPRRKNFEKET